MVGLVRLTSTTTATNHNIRSECCYKPVVSAVTSSCSFLSLLTRFFCQQRAIVELQRVVHQSFHSRTQTVCAYCGSVLHLIQCGRSQRREVVQRALASNRPGLKLHRWEQSIFSRIFSDLSRDGSRSS